MWFVEMIKKIFLLSLTIVCFNFPSNIICDDMKIYKYPYHASKERIITIENGYEKIKIGMSEGEVVKLMGSPDETHQLFSNKNSTNSIGYTHWYILQRIKEQGSALEKSEHLARITYNLDGQVVRKDKW